MGDRYTVEIDSNALETAVSKAVMIQTNQMLKSIGFHSTGVLSFKKPSPELAEITKLDLKKQEITIKFLGGEEKVYPIVKIENYGVVKSDG